MKKYLFPAILVLALAALLFLVFHRKEKGEYVFGSLLPLSGQVAAYGEMMQRGQLMAVDDILEEYGDSVKIVFFNTKHLKDDALNRMQDAHNMGIKYLVEVFGSDQVEHCMNYASDHGMFILSGVDTKYELVEEGKGNFARIMPSDAAASQEILRWMEKEGAKTVAILYVNDDWGEGLLHSAQACIKESSLELVGVFDMNRSQDSFSSTVAKMKAKNPDAVCMFVYPDDGGRYLKEAYRQQFTPGFYATENFTGEDMIKTAQNAAAGVRMVVPSTSDENEQYKKMVQKYTAKYKEEPTIFALKGYDAVHVLYDLLKKAKSTDVKSVKRLIESGGYEFTGVTGPIQFDNKGEYVVTSYDHFEFIFTDEGIKTKRID